MRYIKPNPIFSRVNYEADIENSATYGGIFRKTLVLLLIIVTVAYATILNFGDGMSYMQLIGGLIISPIAGFIMVIMAHRIQHLSFMFSILYALFEGVFLGLITLFVATQAGTDAVFYALTATFGTVFVMLILYSTRIIKVTSRVRSFLITALVSVFFMGIMNIVLFYLYDAYIFSTLYISISVFSALISAFFLLYDFSRIENAITSNVDKTFEWSLSLGLVTTIVWLYIEILRLVLILSRRR